MNYEISEVLQEDRDVLAELRIAAMRESLENVGRFDPVRARDRFLSAFSADDTRKILVNNELAGFYVLKRQQDHYYLDHLYFHPQYQASGLGSKIINSIKKLSRESGMPVRLGALRNSRANKFYKRHGFSYTHEDAWDIYYEFRHVG